MDSLLRLLTEKLRNPVGFIVAIVAGIGALFGALNSAYGFFINFPSPWGYVIAGAVIVATLIQR